MNYKLELLIIKNRAKLEQMIREESDYNKIVKQSQRLDKYLNMKMRELVKQFSHFYLFLRIVNAFFTYYKIYSKIKQELIDWLEIIYNKNYLLFIYLV